MCPGGRVINASSEEGHAVTNGMSDSGRDSGTANSGLLVDVRPSDFDSDDPLAGIEFQRRYERLAWEAGRRQGQENGRQEAEAESDQDKEMIPEEELHGAYEALSDVIPQMDYDSVELILAQLSDYALPPEDDAKIKELKKMLEAFDWDGMEELIAK